MKADRWRLLVTIGVIAGLLLGLAGTILGVKAQGKGTSSPEPATTLVAPQSGATLSGTVQLLAAPINPNVRTVEFLLNGGTFHNVKVGVASLSLVGWGTKWDSTTAANGTYTLVSVGYDSTGQSSTSSPVSITVRN